MMDVLGLQKALETATGKVEVLLPQLTTALEKLIDSADSHLDGDVKDLFQQLNQTLGLLTTDLWAMKKEGIDDLHGLLDRVNGAALTVTLKIPERK